MALRWIPFSRVSMQRAGVLTIVSAAASDARPTNLEGIARTYAATLRQPVVVPEAERDRVARYLREQRLWKRYPSFREERLPEGATVELQDLWLADPRLPAATGAITDDVIDEPPQLAASVRLIRSNNFTRTDRGRALMALLDGVDTAPLPQQVGDEKARNLFDLSLGARAFLAYTLLEADLDFMRVAYEVAPLDAGEFTRAEFADELNEACRRLRARWIRQARSGADRRLLARLDEWARQIDKPRRSGKDWGGGRPPDQLATLRLEPYVDFGLVTRTSRKAYRYTLDLGQRAFFDELVGADDSDRFLNRVLFRRFLLAMGHEPEPIHADEVWQRVRSAYNRLKSALGFASFYEVTLLAIGQLLNEDGSRYFEVGDGLDAIRERQRNDPRRIRFGVRRGGGLTYMKIVESRGKA
jgi:hypothetical protein